MGHLLSLTACNFCLLPCTTPLSSVLSVGSRLYRLTQDPALKKALDDLVNELVNHQTEYGYVGPWPASHQFKKDAPNCETPWDAWGHHRVLVGAHAWSEASKSGQAGMLLTPIADMLLLKFGADAAALHSLGGQSANGAVIDSFATMFMSTDADKFLLGTFVDLALHRFSHCCRARYAAAIPMPAAAAHIPHALCGSQSPSCHVCHTAAYHSPPSLASPQTACRHLPLSTW